MRKEWEKKTLVELCDFYNGLWTGKKPPYTEVGVIRNTNFTKDGQLDDSDIVYLQVEQKQFEKRKLQFGDIILEKSGGGPKQPVGRVVVFNKKKGLYSFSNFTSAIRVKDKDLLNFHYLHLYLYFEYISGATEAMQSHSTGIRNLKFDDYKQIKIPLPPLSEQKQIVAILDKAFAAIDRAKAKAEQNLRNARELFDGYLNEIFTKKGKDWGEDALENLFEIKPPKQQVKEKLKPNAKVSFLPMEDLNVLTRTVTANKERTLSEVYTGYTYFETDDVLLAKITPCFENGKLGLAKNLTNNTGFGSSEYIVFRQNGRVIPELLYYFLSRNSFREDGKQHMKGAVGHKRVEKEFVENYKMPYPKDKTEQIQFVRKFDSLSGQCSQLEKIYQQKIDNLEELKKSILQRAFAGELTAAPQAIPA